MSQRLQAIRWDTMDGWECHDGVAWIRGEGRPLLFLPSSQGHPIFYTRVGRLLAEHWRVILLHYPGEYGGPNLVIRDWESMCRWVEGVMESIGGNEKVWVCGTSYGAVLGLALVTRNPKKYRSAVLHVLPWQCPRNKLTCVLLHTLDVRNKHGLIGLLFRIGSLYALAPEYFHLPKPIRKECRRWFFPLWRKYRTPTTVMGLRIALIAHFPELYPPRHLALPVWIIAGEPGRDHLVPHDSQEKLVSAWGFQGPYVLRGTGHLGPWTDPEGFVSMVESCFRAVKTHDKPICLLT